MGLDTKSSNIKSNPLLKIGTVIITVILCCAFVINAIPLATELSAFGEDLFKGNKTVYDTLKLQSQLGSDVDYIVTSASADKVIKSYDISLSRITESEMKRFKEAREFYLSDKDEINKSFNIWNGIEEDGEFVEDYDEKTYEAKYELDALSAHHIYSTDFNTVVYEHSVNPKSAAVPEFSVPEDNTFTVSIDIEASDNEARQEIKSCFKEAGLYYRGRPVSEFVNGDYDEPLESKTLTYYVKTKDGKVISNTDDVDALINGKSPKNYIVVGKDGVEDYGLYNLVEGHLQYSGSLIDNIESCYIRVDIKPENDDGYSQALALYNRVTDGSVDKAIIKCAVYLLLLVIMLIIQCVLAGHSHGEIKTTIVDKVPNELRLALDGGIFAGAMFLILIMLDYYFTVMEGNYPSRSITYDFYTSALFKPAVMGCFSLGWLALTELFTSYARQIKAKGLGFLKNSIIYFVLRLIIKGLKWAYDNLIKKPVSLLKYKPESFKKQLIAYLIGYAALNTIILLLTGFWLLVDIPLLSFASGVLWFAMNTVSVILAARYIIALDKIIVSIKSNTVPNLDYNRLPNSLRLLYDYEKSSHEQLGKAVEDAVTNERMRVELITNVSHDLKTPLTSIINYVDLLKGCDIQDEQALEYIGVLDDKGAKLKRLIEDLIEASKITSGVITLNPVQLDLSELATQAVVEHQSEFADNNLELIFKGDKESHIAFADGKKTYRVIENLLSNARKYSASGSRVYADVYEQNGVPVFEIKNISAEKLDITTEELKKRFVRGDKSRNLEGNGLGLSIADNLCNAMNGRLEISIDGDLFKAKVFLPRK